MVTKLENLCVGIKKALSKYGSRTYLKVGNETLTYDETNEKAHSLASILYKYSNSTNEYIGVFGYRTKNVYISILGTILSGNAYLPLNPRFPVNRLVKMIELSSCKTIVLNRECIEMFVDLGNQIQPLTIICPEEESEFSYLKTKFPQHKFFFVNDFESSEDLPNFDISPDSPLYLLFTSGSTGEPKGVSVNQKNVRSYLEYTINRYEVSPDDRFSQMFDITFDLSVHDIFVSLLCGASLFVVPENSLMAPAKFIKDNNLTYWFSVPSVGMFMERMKMLKPKSYPSLRYSLFCGEALSQKIAELWQAAAPNSFVENLYGPTEATIAITNYRWDSEKSPQKCINGIVPIGKPFTNSQVSIIDPNMNSSIQIDEGELCLSGPQVTDGYLNNPGKTAEKFVKFQDNENQIWYKTGDLVKQDSAGNLYYLGRIDNQIQIRGHRVELQEVDQILKDICNTELVVSVPKKLNQGSAESICAFLQGNDNPDLKKEIIESCKKNLPFYMVPSDILFIDKLPLNSNGKIDRKSLTDKLL